MNEQVNAIFRQQISVYVPRPPEAFFSLQWLNLQHAVLGTAAVWLMGLYRSPMSPMRLDLWRTSSLCINVTGNTTISMLLEEWLRRAHGEGNDRHCHVSCSIWSVWEDLWIAHIKLQLHWLAMSTLYSFLAHGVWTTKWISFVIWRLWLKYTKVTLELVHM